MHKRAFTLTELLVVVVIIGVLSAVVLPKFTKVIETRRTGEAEGLLAAVRNEQEARCTLDKKYVRNAANLNSVEGVSGNSFAYGKNYQFTLDSTGMTAKRTDKDYALKMKSYYDGKICCEGAYCSKLNKNYIDCKDYTPVLSGECAAPLAGEEGLVTIEPCQPDYTHTEGQEETIPDGECTIKRTWHFNDNPEVCKWEKTDVRDCPQPPVPVPQGCDDSHAEGETFDKAECECGKAKYKWHCGEDTAYAWQEKLIEPCAGKPQDETRDCPQGTQGTQTKTYTCQNGKWVAGDWQGECLKTCEGEASRRCGCALRGTQTRTCDTATGQWTAWGSCSVAETPSSKYEEETCSFYTSYNYSPLSDTPGAWVNTGFALTGKRSRSFNTTTCEWGTWSKCVANAYVSLGPFTKASNRHYCTSGNQSYCGGGQQGLNSPCDWPQSGGISGPYCPSRFGDGCYIYQCQQLTEP